MTLRQRLKRRILRIPGIRGLVERLEALEARSEAIEAQFKDLSRTLVELQAAFKKLEVRIDLVDLGPLKVFHYTDDFVYQRFPPAARNYQLKAEDLRQARNRPKTNTVDELYDLPLSDSSLMGLLMAHYWKWDLDFVYLDVGCQYGTTAMKVALAIASCGKQARVVAFEPGKAGELAPFNFALNGFGDWLVFEPLAVSNLTAPSILYGETGHTENNRIVNRQPGSEAYSRVVNATTIDDYLRSRGIDSHVIIKVDTQGAEPEVWAGMERTREDRYTTAVLEFTPHALVTRVDPLEFLKMIGRDSEIHDLRPSIRRVDPASFGDFTERVSKSRDGWTDLLIVPRKLPGFEELARRLNTPPQS
jgi:FkbM family methyltransferase